MLMLWPIIVGLALSPAQISGPVSDLEARAACSDNVAYSSNGRMAVGLNAAGQIDTLRWPGSAGPDHLSYRSVACDENAVSQSLTHKLAANMGLFLGLSQQNHPPRWMPQFSSADDVNSIHVGPLNPGSTTLRFAAQDGPLHQVVEYRLVPEKDLLMIRVEISADDPRDLPDRLWLLANLAPRAQAASSGAADWQGDAPGQGNDFAALFSEQADALLHFALDEDSIPADLAERFAALGEDAESHRQADQILQDLIENETSGRFFALGADVSTLSYQVGREDPLDQARPQDAFFDAQDALLQRQAGVMGQVDALLVPPLQQQLRDDEDSSSENLRVVTLFLAAGENAAAALEQVEAARLQGFAQIEERVRAEESRWLRTVALANDDDSAVQALALNSLRRVSAALDIYSGALAAAVDAQPGLNVDCPVWSMFMEQALDLSGQDELVTAHSHFLADVQNNSSQQHPGTWATCYFSDGQPSPIASESGLHAAAYSLDASALALWSWQAHYQHLVKMGQTEQAKNLKVHLQPGFDLALTALLDCEDVDNNLACLAPAAWGERPRQDLYASVSLSLGLQAALLWLVDDDKDDPEIEIVQARLSRLHQAIWQHFVDGEGQLSGDAVALAWALVDPELWRDHSAQLQTQFQRSLDQLSLHQQHSWSADWPFQLWSLSQAAQRDDLLLTAQQKSQLKNLVYDLAAVLQQDMIAPGALWRSENVASGDEVNPDPAWLVQTRLGRPFAPASALLYTSIVSIFGRRAPADTQGPIESCTCNVAARSGIDSSLIQSSGTVFLYTATLAFLFLWRRRQGAWR